jgi:hypothetical protein
MASRDASELEHVSVQSGRCRDKIIGKPYLPLISPKIKLCQGDLLVTACQVLMVSLRWFAGSAVYAQVASIFYDS